MSLVARHIEASGVPTVIIGSARDIVEECGVARFVFTDLPLGNPIGPPADHAAHDQTIQLALDLAESARSPRTTVQSPARWPNDDWRDSFMAVDDQNRAALRAAGERRRSIQAQRRPHSPD